MCEASRDWSRFLFSSPTLPSISLQYNFQHAELQAKKEKLSRLEEKRNEEANSMSRSLTAAREMLRRLREDSNNDTSYSALNANLSPGERRKKLEKMMEVDGGEELLSNLPELLGMRRAQKLEELKQQELRNASLRRIIAGYQNALGVSSMEFPSHLVGANVVMQQ